MLSSVSEWLQSIDKVKSEFTLKKNLSVYQFKGFIEHKINL